MNRFGKFALIVGIVGAVSGAAADPLSDRARPYRYVSLGAALPAGFLVVDPVKVTEDRRVHGTAWACPASCVPSIVVYRNGKISVLNDGMAYSANEHGVVGGSVLVDPDNFIEQAALFRDGRTELIPRLQGESSSHVRKVTNSGIALVESVDTSSVSTFYLYQHRHKGAPLDLGPDFVLLDVNDAGVLAGTSVIAGLDNDRAFRFDSSSGLRKVLNPLPSEPESWGQRINSRGDVLGYSFVFEGLERIGVWHNRTFQTYFVEGTAAFPTISNKLLWNEAGLFVITDTAQADQNSYLVPRPNLRLKLADLSDALPHWTLIADVNDNGDLVGSGGSSFYNSEDAFLLERVGHLPR